MCSPPRPSPRCSMNHLSTMYATKRRRRNSKSVRVPPKEGPTKSNPSKRHRERLNAELDTLASLLPFDQNVLSKLDKLSILRLSVSYLRTKSYFQAALYRDQERPAQEHAMKSRDHLYNDGLAEGDLILQALSGFLLILTCDGEVFYASHTVETYLGFHQEVPTRLLKKFSNKSPDQIHLEQNFVTERKYRITKYFSKARGVNETLFFSIDRDELSAKNSKFCDPLQAVGRLMSKPFTFVSAPPDGASSSDICHQSVYELVHSEDREELQRHLMWNSQLPSDRSALSLQEALLPENSQFLERNFTVRFRCLLDNTSGFLRLDIRGRIKVLHGQNHKTEEPPLALFAVCTPFGPPSLLEMPHKDTMFKSKHKLDLSLVSLDQRAKQVLGYSDTELADKGCYDLVHYDDLAYVASAHQELLKTGASGLIAYRLVTKTGSWQWLQTSARLVYKNSKPDFILCTHRPLMEEEGRDLLGKRTMDFKVTYLDGGLGSLTDRSGLLSDSDFVLRCQRTRRYKSQIRDLITTCRKRKSPVNGPVTTPTIVGGAIPDTTTYMDDAAAAATAAVVAGYNNVYPYGTTENVNGLGASYAAAAMPQNLFTAAIDNTRFLSAENFLHYRPIGTYYPDYAVAQYPSNSFLDVSASATAARTCFAPGPFSADPSQNHQLNSTKEDKLYHCQMEAAKFGNSSHSPQQITGNKTPTSSSCCDTSYLSTNGVDPLRGCIVNSSCNSGVQSSPPLLPIGLDHHDIKVKDLACSNNLTFPLNSMTNSTDCISSGLSKPLKSGINGTTSNSILMSIRDLPHWHKEEKSPSFDSNRQSVLMWNNTSSIRDSISIDCPSTTCVSLSNYDMKLPRYCESNNKQDSEIGNVNSSPCKWSGNAAAPKSASPHNSTSPASGKVAPQVTYSATPYSQDMRLELPLVRSDVIRPSSIKLEGNPLLSISEVTNTLLDHH